MCAWSLLPVRQKNFRSLCARLQSLLPLTLVETTWRKNRETRDEMKKEVYLKNKPSKESKIIFTDTKQKLPTRSAPSRLIRCKCAASSFALPDAEKSPRRRASSFGDHHSEIQRHRRDFCCLSRYFSIFETSTTNGNHCFRLVRSKLNLQPHFFWIILNAFIFELVKSTQYSVTCFGIKVVFQLITLGIP